MKTIASLGVVLMVLASCDDDPSGTDGGTDTRVDVASQSDGPDATMDAPVQEAAVSDGGPSIETEPGDPDAAGPEAAPDRPDVTPRTPSSWWTLGGGTIISVQPVAGVFGSEVVVAGGRSTAAMGNMGLRNTWSFTVPGPMETSVEVKAGMMMSVPRWGAASAFAGGRLYAIGGSSVGVVCLASTESLGAANGAWTVETFNLPQPRCGASTAVLGQYVYLTGGSTAPVPIRQPMLAPLSTCRLDTMNLAAGWDCSLTAGDDVPALARFNAASASGGSVAVIVGGRNETNPLAAVSQVSQMAGNPAFVAGTDLPAPLNLPGVASANGYFYLFGGSPNVAPGGPAVATLFRTSNATPSGWSSVAAAGEPSTRSGHVLVAARCAGCSANRLYAIGGHRNGVLEPSIDEYTE